METKNDFATNAIRVGIGTHLLAQGLNRMGNKGEKFENWLEDEFREQPLPEKLVKVGARAIPPLDILLGGLLITGYKQKHTLLATTAFMGALAVGLNMINWRSRAVMRTSLLFLTAVLYARTNQRVPSSYRTS